jgi:hypothetical protein
MKTAMHRALPFGMAALVLVATLLWPWPVFSHETLTTTVLFDREIVRILNSHCVMCHTEGGPSFPLATYEQAWLQKRPIRASVIARHMPPWAAVPGYGRYMNENVVTLRESQFVVSWVEGLGPRNAGTVFTNTADSSGPRTQAVRARADFGHWQLGEPSLARTLEPMRVEARPMPGAPSGPGEHVENVVRRTTVDLGLASDARVRAVEYMPGDRRVVRAAFFTVQETGQWIGSWTPWYGFVKLPPWAAFTLSAGSHIVAEVHYGRSDETIVDRGTLGLFFARQPPPDTVSDLVVDARGDVLAGATSQRFHAQAVLAADTDILALRPEVWPGIRSIEVSARRPDGGTDVLLFAKDIPLDWPTPYILESPVRLRRGTALGVTVYYTNDAATPIAGGVHLTVSTVRRRMQNAEGNGPRTKRGPEPRTKAPGTTELTGGRS